MTDRVLVMGDNHGDTESLRRVLDDVGDETFDFAVHVGDFTDAWRTSRRVDDEDEGKKRGVEQLRDVEPLLEEIDACARHGLLWVWGNQDYFGDLDYDLDVGTAVPDDVLTVGGRRFTNSPDLVDSDTVLVTHMEHWRLLDHFEGTAHFCGNTHRGRWKERRLNSSFLQVRDPDTGTKQFGGYFVVELGSGSGFDVEMRPIGDLERVSCDRHRERGVQFQPSDRGCMYCRDQRVLMREMCATAFYGQATNPQSDSVAAAELVDYAAALWTESPAGFRDTFREYLADVDEDRYAPLTSTDDGRLALAARSYAY